MKEQTFVVTHAKAREPLTIKGKDLEDALEKEGLNPELWYLLEEPELPPEEQFGDNS